MAARAPVVALLLLLLLLLLFSLVAAGCGQQPGTGPRRSAAKVEPSEGRLAECVIVQGTVSSSPATGTTFQTLKPGLLTVGSNTSYPPFESIENDRPVGFDIALVSEIARRLGLRPEIESAPFDSIFGALATHRFDAVISAVTITQDRKKTVDFTNPYLSADQSLAVRAGDASKFRDVNSLAGSVVGVQSGTTGATCAFNALKAKGKVRDVRSYDNAPTAFDDLLAGRVQAVLNDLPTSRRVVEQKPGLAIVQVLRTDEQYGIAVAKDNPNLREAINRQLADIRKDGTYREIYRQWLGTEPPSEQAEKP